MKRIVDILLISLGFFISLPSICQELSGYIQLEVTGFASNPLWTGQGRNNISISAQPEFYKVWEKSGSTFTFVPFARFDKTDPERSHFDIRELNYLWVNKGWELRMGIGKVFWGTTEFVHLVDIINQTDAVESIEGTEKLGQPMINLSIPRQWGVIDIFVLPYFRERTFPGKQGRLRFPVVVDTNNAIYESSQKQHHTDFALRYSHSIGNWDLGISHFMGTGRDPSLILKSSENGGSKLTPFYHQINQTGLDLQFIGGKWLYKLEALYRTGQGKDFIASVAGLEYTFSNRKDLTLFAEWAYDTRGEKATTLYQNDVVAGFHLRMNDPSGTIFTSGIIHDLDHSSNALKIEGSRRFGSNLRMSMESWMFFNVNDKDMLYGFRDDDFIRLKLTYYF
ncbi:MAG: hypothetical protein KAR17_13080 [Cyclobacteriaceae bacterium]|nr:hypothetical protein [Cyclobacteriaceae bacterium]